MHLIVLESVITYFRKYFKFLWYLHNIMLMILNSFLNEYIFYVNIIYV